MKRIYKRVTTTERIVVQPREDWTGPLNGDNFRVEIFLKNGLDEKLVYEREHKGSIEVEELDDGKFILTGEVSFDKTMR